MTHPQDPAAPAAAEEPRLRTMVLPNGKWIFVLDRFASQAHHIAPSTAEDLKGFAEQTGAAATAVFAFAVDVVDAIVDEALQEGR